MSTPFQYPKGPDDPDIDAFTRDRWKVAHRVVGSGNVDELFQGGSDITPTPWPQATRMKRRQSFDKGLVQEAIRNPQFRDLDPAQLHSTQPNVTRAGVTHYMGDEYERTGTTFADMDQAGNRHPVVYNREGQNMILSGHHRAAAALLKGEQFRANYLEGPWGS